MRHDELGKEEEEEGTVVSRHGQTTSFPTLLDRVRS